MNAKMRAADVIWEFKELGCEFWTCIEEPQKERKICHKGDKRMRSIGDGHPAKQDLFQG